MWNFELSRKMIRFNTSAISVMALLRLNINAKTWHRISFGLMLITTVHIFSSELEVCHWNLLMLIWCCNCFRLWWNNIVLIKIRHVVPSPPLSSLALFLFLSGFSTLKVNPLKRYPENFIQIDASILHCTGNVNATKTQCEYCKWVHVKWLAHCVGKAHFIRFGHKKPRWKYWFASIHLPLFEGKTLQNEICNRHMMVGTE